MSTDSGTDYRIRERFESIKRARRVRWIGYGTLIGLIGYLFASALLAVEWFSTNRQYGVFTRRATDFFPFLSTEPPFFAPSGFAEYGAYIHERSLLYNRELLGQYPGPLSDPLGFLIAIPDLLLAVLISEGGPLTFFGVAGTTLSMAVAGTVMGFPFALLFGILGSERVTPFPFNFIFRGMMSTIRAIPALVWALIFIPLSGLGPVTATIAIAVDTVGNLGRLFVDELEEIEDGPIEAMETTGASRRQTITFGMLSQVHTPFIAWTLYIFEINVRIAVALGIIGGGGLGQVLEVQMGLFAYTNAMATILVILILIISVEMFSQRIRARIRADDTEPMGLWELLKGFPKRMAKSLAK
ncbi:phosphonate ABC transporter, permease protein PhnE [Natronosalvus vescus]|uniref:phosphonate ABC transporter, permease protein PhnE n=1 Tax=Natronosalvus vescus TaxID=2953881 RepID=UPI002090A022|nr:phosphonate ABC transporter, permease protein PhnE [Natronosalvus vescus]